MSNKQNLHNTQRCESVRIADEVFEVEVGYQMTIRLRYGADVGRWSLGFRRLFPLATRLD